MGLYLKICSANFLFPSDYEESTSAQPLRQLPCNPKLGKPTVSQFPFGLIGKPQMLPSRSWRTSRELISSFFGASLTKSVPEMKFQSLPSHTAVRGPSLMSLCLSTCSGSYSLWYCKVLHLVGEPLRAALSLKSLERVCLPHFRRI